MGGVCVRGCILQGLGGVGWVAVVGLWGNVGKHPLRGRSECAGVLRAGLSVSLYLERVSVCLFL